MLLNDSVTKSVDEYPTITSTVEIEYIVPVSNAWPKGVVGQLNKLKLINEVR